MKNGQNQSLSKQPSAKSTPPTTKQKSNSTSKSTVKPKSTTKQKTNSASKPTVKPKSAPTSKTTTKPKSTSKPNSTTPTPKKKHTGLIISIIIATIVLIGGGVFAAFAIIKNNPTNMLVESFNHLTTTDQVAINGNFSINPKNLGLVGVESINLNFDAKRAGSNQQTDANLQMKYTDGTSTDTLKFGEIMLQDGVFYLHVEGLNNLYQNNLRPLLSTYASYIVQSLYSQQLKQSCNNYSSSNYSTCINNNSKLKTIINQKSAKLLAKLDSIIANIDDKWFEFSIEEILNSDFITKQLGLPTSTEQSILSAYNCSVDTINKFSSDYANEFNNLYDQHSFIELASGNEGYYNVSIKAPEFADYANSIPKTKFYQDLSKCTDTSLPTDSYEVNADSISQSLTYLPNIALRFDGFLDHHLTDVKVSQSNDYYDFNLDVNITYPANLQVTAPSNSRPITDLIQEIYTSFISVFQS